jgi:hypothetical protein
MMWFWREASLFNSYMYACMYVYLCAYTHAILRDIPVFGERHSYFNTYMYVCMYTCVHIYMQFGVTFREASVFNGYMYVCILCVCKRVCIYI